MADTYLVCEGHGHSIDLRVLDIIVAQRLGASVKIVASGGDSGLNAVRAFHEEKSRKFRKHGKKRGKLGPPDDKAFSIQDRNFHSRQRADDTWASQARSLMWRRHEIENYLLAPRVVLTAFNSLRTAPKYVTASWVTNLPVDEIAVFSLLMNLARPLLEGHAGQLLRFKLDSVIKQGRAFSLPNPGSSTRGWSKAQWLAHLHREGQRIQTECNAVINLSDLSLAAIDQQYDAMFSRIGTPEFLKSGKFLEEMGGHELMSALIDHLHSLGGTTIGLIELEEELLKAIDTVYQPGLFNPDDFADLAVRLQ